MNFSGKTGSWEIPRKPEARLRELELKPSLLGFEMTCLAMLLHIVVEILEGFSEKMLGLSVGTKRSNLLQRVVENSGALVLDIKGYQTLRKIKKLMGLNGIGK